MNSYELYRCMYKSKLRASEVRNQSLTRAMKRQTYQESLHQAGIVYNQFSHVYYDLVDENESGLLINSLLIVHNTNDIIQIIERSGYYGMSLEDGIRIFGYHFKRVNGNEFKFLCNFVKKMKGKFNCEFLGMSNNMEGIYKILCKNYIVDML